VFRVAIPNGNSAKIVSTSILMEPTRPLYVYEIDTPLSVNERLHVWPRRGCIISVPQCDRRKRSPTSPQSFARSAMRAVPCDDDC
jgi:hypothetical protein